MPLFMLPIYPWILVKVRKAQTHRAASRVGGKGKSRLGEGVVRL